MFTGELAESRQTEVVIRDIDERAMELLIDFAYTSQVTAAAAAFPTRDWKLLFFFFTSFHSFLIAHFYLLMALKFGPFC